MTRPYDAAVKQLIETYPADWLALAGLPATAPIEVLDADVSSIAAAADKVLLVRDAAPWLMHFELQSSGESGLAERLHWYNALLRHRHGRRVRSVLVLLRPAADGPALTGVFEEQFPDAPAHLVFRYSTVRVWRQSVEQFLQGGLGTLPLAPISNVPETELPAVVGQMDERLRRETAPEQAAVVLALSLVLAGLRLPVEQVLELFRGVHFMSIVKDSSMYEWFVEQAEKQVKEEVKKEGIKEGIKEVILRQGTKRFGAPEEAIKSAIEGVQDLPRLERMSERMLEARSWQEILTTE